MEQDHKKDSKKGVGMTQVWRSNAGENIRLRREQLGWTQETLLKRLRELSGEEAFYKGKDSISQIEKGVTAPPWDKMLQIARVIGMTMERLAGLCPPPTPSALQYTNNIQGDSYTDSVVVGATAPGALTDQIYAAMLKRGMLVTCPVCAERDGQAVKMPEPC